MKYSRSIFLFLNLLICFCAVANAAPPPPPSNLAATSVSSSQINLTWTDNSTIEKGFNIERAMSSGGPWSQIASVSTDVTSYQNTGLSEFTTYYYRVSSFNSTGMSSYSNVVSATTSISTTIPTTTTTVSTTTTTIQPTTTVPAITTTVYDTAFWQALFEQSQAQLQQCQAELQACQAPPTNIELSTLDAVPSDKRVLLKWKTESETDNAGFNIWRAEGFVKMNNSVIPALGSPTAGSEYDFVDEWVLNGKWYFYLLEDIDNNGISTFHGPVKAVPRWWR